MALTKLQNDIHNSCTHLHFRGVCITNVIVVIHFSTGTYPYRVKDNSNYPYYVNILINLLTELFPLLKGSMCYTFDQ